MYDDSEIKKIYDDNTSNLRMSDFELGATVNYARKDYCVIKNDDADDYVSLLLKDPLSYNELMNYYDAVELYYDYNKVGKDTNNNNIGISVYNQCNGNYSGCNYYNNSFIKKIVDEWGENLNSSKLKTVNGYQVRLITDDELTNLGHTLYRRQVGTSSWMVTNKSNYDCLYGSVGYWTMNPSTDSGSSINIVVSLDNLNSNANVSVEKKYAIRPVINLKKCVIKGTC